MTEKNVRQRDVGNGAAGNHKFDGESMVTKSDREQSTCTKLYEACTRMCSPCLVRFNPLPENADASQKIANALRLPPHGHVGSYIRFIVVCLQIWVILYTLTHSQALPGGNFFSLLILFVCCVAGGYLISFIRLPPLLGMLIVGVLLRNIPGLSVIGENIDTKYSSVLKKIALTVILTRAGLGLDVVKLKKLSWAVLRLAFTPSLLEAITGGVVSRLLLGFPWTWSLMLGCILGALSPAVTVPSLVNLQERRYGVAKGIPTMLLAAGGLDNVLCITGFSVFLGIIFSEGDLAITIIKGPLGAVAGVVYGFVVGIGLWYIPAKDSANPVFYRSLMLFLSGMIAVFGSSEVGLAGAGPLGCLTTATVANYKWRQQRKPGETDEVSAVMGLAWLIVQHYLFGLIGSAVNISHIKSSTAGLGIATLAIGLVVRSIASFTVTLGTGFNMRERVFILMTWLSKATVQAAIGGLALDRVKLSDNPDPEQERIATDILTISVLAIIICAPTGATLMAVFGPRFLEKGDDDEVELEVVTHDNKETSSNGVIAPKTDDAIDILEQTSDVSYPDLPRIDVTLDTDGKLLSQNSDDVTTGIVNPCFDENALEALDDVDRVIAKHDNVLVESEPVTVNIDSTVTPLEENIDCVTDTVPDKDTATNTVTNIITDDVTDNESVTDDVTATVINAVTNIDNFEDKSNNVDTEDYVADVDRNIDGTDVDNVPDTITSNSTENAPGAQDINKSDDQDTETEVKEVFRTVLDIKLPKQ